MNTSTNTNLPRRSPLLRWHQEQEATMDGGLPLSYRKEKNQAQLGLSDLTALPRVGYKGVETIAWLEKDYTLPEMPNTAVQAESHIVARLSQQELFFAALSPKDETVAKLKDSWSIEMEQKAYQLERGDSHACIAISGENTANLMAKLCGVDLRPHKFAIKAVAQTSVARINTIIIRVDSQLPDSQLLLMIDLSSVEYMWQCLLDASTEYNGGAIGYLNLQNRW